MNSQLKNEIIKLNNDDFNLLLLERKKHIFKFNQLKPEMIFIINDGHDNYKNIIKKVNLNTKIFEFIDLSYPEISPKYMEIQYSNFLYIPFQLYENEEMFDKQIEFKFIEINENQIMQLYNTKDYEKVLYYRYYIKSLLKIIQIQKIKFNKLKTDFDIGVYKNIETTKILNLKHQINILLKKYCNNDKNELNNIEPYKRDKFDELNFENKLKRQKELTNIWIQKAEKYKELYLEKLGN
jgi:hypothetical protein